MRTICNPNTSQTQTQQLYSVADDALTVY